MWKRLNCFPKKVDITISTKVEVEGKVQFDNIAKKVVAYKLKDLITYKMINEYIESKCDFKVYAVHIAIIKKGLSY